MQLLEFIPYQPQYRDDCIALFRSNRNGYFSPDEELNFTKFLENQAKNCHYHVGMKDNRVIACGGWDKQKKGFYLRWGIVDHAHHKLGLGTKLLEFRINEIERHFGTVDIFIKTSGKAQGFYRKSGFCIDKIIPDGIIKGIDEYQMRRPAVTR